MLTHHDQRDYHIAASEAAKRARPILQELIDKGRTKAANVIKAIQTQQPEDRLVKGSALEFAPYIDCNRAGLLCKMGDEELKFHPHALQQAAAKVEVPWAYMQNLVTPDAAPWALQLAAHNLNTLYKERIKPDTRFLARSVAKEVRGFLSDRFRRLDSRPIIESFIDACKEIGALACEGYVTDTKIAIKAVLPMIFEPVPNEVMVFGVVFENSDFGNGAASLRGLWNRLWCTNYAITSVDIREVHLGGRLGEDIRWSDKTYELDTKRIASAVADVVKAHLAPAAIDKLMDAIRSANDQKLEPQEVAAFLRKTLTKGETDAVIAKFNTPDVEMLPPGNSMWRLSNAVSWLAGEMEDKERALDLMKTAGTLLPKAAA